MFFLLAGALSVLPLVGSFRRFLPFGSSQTEGWLYPPIGCPLFSFHGHDAFYHVSTLSWLRKTGIPPPLSAEMGLNPFFVGTVLTLARIFEF